MIVFVLLGSLCLIACAVALVADIMRGLDAGQFAFTPLGKTWFDLDSSSLNFSQAMVQRYTFPEIWDPGISTVLNWPTVFVSAGAGVALLLIAGVLQARRNAREVS